jgi:hypothetical protein
MFSGFQEGGSFFFNATITVLAGASLSSCIKTSLLAPVCEAIAAYDDAEMVELGGVASSLWPVVD